MGAAGRAARVTDARAARSLGPAHGAQGKTTRMTVPTTRLAGLEALPDHHPWPRHVVTPELWVALGEDLAAGGLDLLGLWGEPGAVHMALHGAETGGQPVVVTLACPGGGFPSIGRLHPPALRLERALQDLVGLVALEIPDERPWLDHGIWPLRHPLAAAPEPGRSAVAYAFLAAEGPGLHQIPVGPIHAGVIEPGHFRFTAQGETVVRLEERLGYVHKGIEKLLVGADPARGARIAGRISGDSTVAYALAFARAVEAATGSEPPERAHWLRALLAELERIANHLNDVGFVCNDAAFALVHAHCGILREQVLQTAERLFGHRLMMDRIVPGGVVVDLDAEGAAQLRRLVAELGPAFAHLARVYDGTPSLMDRTTATGIVDPALARRFAAGGFVGRASGRGFDARKSLPYPPYDRLRLEVPVQDKGDVDARVRVRIAEIEASLSLVLQIVQGMPEGPIRTEPESRAGEGMALVEGFRGDILVWLRLDEAGRIARCHARDPSWFQWPLLEAAIEGNIVADFPLCNKSFNCSYSGVDL